MFGLTSEEAQERIKKFGLNEIPEKKKNPIVKFLSYFWGPIPWMIEIAGVISLIIHHMVDFWIIFTLLISNAIVGFIEEHSAENVIELLKKKMALTARVFRDGKWQTIDAKYLVPGDVIKIRIGDIIPADARIEDGYIMADESSLTGESLPIEKRKGDTVYSGAIAKRGEATAVVIATGTHTYFAKSVKLVETSTGKSLLQKMLIKIGDYLIFLAIILIGIIFIVGLFRGENISEILKYSLILAVASIPAALPTVLSITLSVGAKNLANKNAVVTKLSSIEDLAWSDVLCSDKTGTLTKNKLMMDEPVPYDGFDKEDVIISAALASKKEDNDPIDNAILSYSDRIESEIKKFEIVNFVPFDPVIKRTEAEVKYGNETFKVSKGAVQVIKKLCENNDPSIDTKVDELAKSGYRAIGVARQFGGKWKFVGIIPLFDPPRDDVKDAITAIRNLGIKIKMITGDSIAIAKHIARIIGIGDRIYHASDISKLSDDEIENADGFSEVFPEHKFNIVKLLQKRGHVVSMTGDGVNDAPALHEANCGIAVSGATDAARAAADVVLLSPGLSVIVDAVREARRVFQRMINYSLYRITETIRVLLFMTLSIIVFNFYPITAVMIALLALLNDIPILTISLDKVKEVERPIKWNYRGLMTLSTLLGVAGVASTFLALYIAKDVFMLSLPLIQTFIFLKLIIAGHSTLFVARNRKNFWKKPYPSKYLLAAILTTDIVATLMSVYGIILKPIGWKLAGFIWVYALAWMLFNDFVKVLTLKFISIEDEI